ncbi:hypothetical protein WR25_26410 [Diploscapter pachys]|uniref:AMP-dependent synthetase/ligase domain-containing protein n=1 Tax=Diploscapter pachys TaxID=2018661 RepID=A0A2A2M129_9BILA|nr:hypothetical protein WR25_26410 [Diploscapter pachys]
MEVQSSFQISWDKTPYQSFSDYFFAKIAAYGSNLAIVDADTGKQWRYSEIRSWCEMCAARLRELQVTPASRVAVITGTTGQAIFVQLACSLIGCSAVAVNGWNTIDEIWQLCDLSEATHLISEMQFYQKADDVRRKAAMRGGGRIKHVRSLDDVLTNESIGEERKKKAPPLTRDSSAGKLVVRQNTASPIPSQVDEIASDPLTPVSEASNETKLVANGYDDSTDASTDRVTAISSDGQNPMLIFFTSGTTGLPKAAELSHRSMIINLQQISLPLFGPVQAKERFLLPLCISHIFGAVSAYYALINGATVYMLSKVYPKVVIEALSNYNINVTHISPTMLHWFALDPLVENHKYAQLRTIICGGAPIDSNLAQVAKNRLGIKDFRQTYGMTELGGMCTLLPYQSEHVESVGCPLPGMLFRVVNFETKQLCPPRQPGQILVIGPQVIPNYYKNPKATMELVDPSGYVKTGDCGFYDETGRIYVLDRVKDIIKYKGTLVCPSEVELVLRAHPGIDDCAVVGRQDHVAGEVPAAFVVKSANHPLLASAEVRQYVAGKIATFKELRGGVFFVSEIPRSPCGKVLRRQMRQFWDRERNNSKAEQVKEAKKPSSQENLTNRNSSPAAKKVANGTRPAASPKRAVPNARAPAANKVHAAARK